MKLIQSYPRSWDKRKTIINVDDLDLFAEKETERKQARLLMNNSTYKKLRIDPAKYVVNMKFLPVLNKHT